MRDDYYEQERQKIEADETLTNKQKQDAIQELIQLFNEADHALRDAILRRD
jgi:lipase chaperone LimK